MQKLNHKNKPLQIKLILNFKENQKTLIFLIIQKIIQKTFLG